MTNAEFEIALEQIIDGATKRGDRATLTWAGVIRSGWKRCKTGKQKRAFRREAERQFKKHLRPVQEVANTVNQGSNENTGDE